MKPNIDGPGFRRSSAARYRRLGAPSSIKQQLFLLGNLLALATASEQPQCDDSKCQNSGFVALPYKIGPCWAEEDVPDSPFVFACADGYEVHKIDSVLATFRYFTCCRPSETTDATSTLEETGSEAGDDPISLFADTSFTTTSSSSALPQCSDEACTSIDGRGGADCWADGPYEPMTCAGSSGYRYPRKTGSAMLYNSVWYSHYACCDTTEGSSPPLKQSYVGAEGFRVAISSLALACILPLLLGLATSKKARARSYNLYLVALAVPDAVYNSLNASIGILALTERHIPCWAMNGFGYFYMTANIWVNALIAHQVYKLLYNSKRRKRTNPPSVRLIARQVAAAYLWAICVGVWGGFSTCGGLPVYPNSARAGNIVVSTTMLAVALVPFLYMGYITVRIWRDKLLPRTGRTRALSIFFARIIMVFIVFWFPVILLLNLERKSTAEGKMHYAAWCLSSIQGIASTALAMMKPDVRGAVVQFLRCRWCRGENDDEGNDIEDDILEGDRQMRWWTRAGSSLSIHRLRSSTARLMSSVRGELKQNIEAIQESYVYDEQNDVLSEKNSQSKRLSICSVNSKSKPRREGGKRMSWNIESILEAELEANGCPESEMSEAKKEAKGPRNGNRISWLIGKRQSDDGDDSDPEEMLPASNYESTENAQISSALENRQSTAEATDDFDEDHDPEEVLPAISNEFDRQSTSAASSSDDYDAEEVSASSNESTNDDFVDDETK